MPKYRIHELSFIDNRLVRPGDEIETDATPAAHWDPLDKHAEKDRKAFDADEISKADGARADSEAKFLAENPANLTPAPPQEVARIKKASKEAATKEAESKAAATDDPLV